MRHKCAILPIKKTALIRIALAAVLLAGGCGREAEPVDVSAYDYRETKNLVRMVAGAARRLEREGLAALDALSPQSSMSGEYYLYVYDLDDVCLYHGGMPELVGKRLSAITDIEGRSVSRLVRDALNNPENPHGWVHYTWWTPGKFYPVPKSSCHFKARLPDGREVYIGSGLDHPHEEREFLRIAVDSAANLLESRGGEALPLIADPLSEYNYRDVRIFAFRADGTLVISPVLGDSRIHVDLSNCRDEAGNRPFDLALRLLETQPAVWQGFIDRSRDERQPIKKTLYLRRIELDQAPLYIGAITGLPHPP